MANLNIPFVLLQKDTCQFNPSIRGSHLIHHSRFNLRDGGNSAANAASAQNETTDEQSQASSSGLMSYIGGVFSSQTQSTKEFKAPIDFGTAKENLLVLADEKTGTMALCSHELHGTDLSQPEIQQNSRLLINIQPRVLLVPSLMAEKGAGPGPLLSHCIIRCPAPHILNASTFWLCTLHADNRLRLWNTDDGRCISVSSPHFLDIQGFTQLLNAGGQEQKSVIEVKGLAILAIEGFPGHIFLFTDAGEVCIVDAYKMQVQSRVNLDSKGFTGCHYIAAQNTLIFCDARGAIYLIQDQFGAANNRVRLDEFFKENTVSESGSGLNLNRQNSSGGPRITEEVKGGAPAIHRQTKSASRRAVGGQSSQMAAGQKRMLKFCRNESVTNFKFQKNMKLGGRETLEVGRLKMSQTLAFDFDTRTKSVAVVVSQDQIEQVIINSDGEESKESQFTRQALKQFSDESILVFAEFVRAPNGSQFLICINIQCKVLVYSMSDLQRPKVDLTEEEQNQWRCDFVQPFKTFQLLDNCQVTDYHKIWIKDAFTELTSEHRTKEEHLQSRLDRLKDHLLDKFRDMTESQADQHMDKKKRCQLFSYSHEENLMYSFVQVNNKNVLIPQETSLMLSWDFRTILAHCAQEEHAVSDANSLPQQLKISMNISNLALFGSQSKQSEPHIPNSLINFNAQMLKSFYNSCHFRFFFTDEKATATVIFQDQDSPSTIIGTNYGRIFMIPMFQEQQFKHVLPTVLIDSHKGSPITKLYLAYQGALQQSSSDGGGHLLSVSEDGTICATDLKSETISKKLYAKGPGQVQTSQKRRTDQFMHEKAKNMRQQRRHSVQQYFSAEDFFKYERIRASQTFEQTAFSPITHIFRVKSFQESHDFLINARVTRQRSKPKLELPKQYYAFVTEDKEVFVLTVHAGQQNQARFKLIKLPLMSEPTVGVFFDQNTNSLFIMGENLSWRQFCLRSHSLSQRRRTLTDALIMLEVPQLVENLISSNDHFFKTMKPDDCDLLSFQNFQKDFNKAKILKGLGTHQCLDFLNLSLSVPLNYSPQSHLLKEYTAQLQHLLALKKDLMNFQESEESQKSMLLAVNKILNWDHDLMMKSDVTRKQASIVAMESKGEHFCGSNQQVLIASTQDMLPALQSKMKRIKALQGQPQQLNDYFGNGGAADKNSSAQRPKTEAVGRGGQASNSPDKRLINTGQQQQEERKTSANQLEQKQQYGMDKYRWPSKILSLVHPFNLHDGMDESLEEFFNFNMPFLDFRIGIQGIDEAFSFIITKEDRNYHNERDHISKIMGLLKISRQLRQIGQKIQKTLVVEDFIEQHIDPQDSTLYLGRFFNSEYWKMSPYLSTIVPAFLLSAFVSIIEYDEKEICLLSQVWLDIVHHIRHASRFKQSCASPLRSPTTLSTSVLSQLLLLQDLNVSSCAKDIIFKPMLCHQSDHDKRELQTEISDWLALVIDTYEELKQETTSQQEEGGPSAAQGRTTGASAVGGDHAVENIMRMTMAAGQERPSSDNPYANGSGGGKRRDHGSNDVDHNALDQHLERRQGATQENRPLSHFFGELEIKGLINISFYAFYCQVDPSQQLGQRDLDRVSKLVVILIREVVQQFQDRKDYIHLLTILLYLLQCNLKTATANFKRKAIMEDVVRLLLFIFNYYKPPLNRELFITRVTSENFNLIRPTNSELYLKLVAAKTLLEIGVSFTEEFLQLIQFHATTLRPSHEHQKNVLETLRYFINGYGENLEKYLIQIVQILLRCLDPNELALRKNSHKYVSVILSNMVKIFPMVAFHYDTQRLAVGTHDGPIGIYDVRTSAKWKILEGHTKNVTCLCFDSKGNYLASYSAVDLTLKLWKVGNTSFFATIMGGTGRFAKQIKLTSLGSNVANPHVHTTQAPNHIEMENRDRKFQETNEISRGIIGGADDSNSGQDQSGAQQSNANSGNRISRCHIKFLRNDKDVELIREDGSKELHSLIR